MFLSKKQQQDECLRMRAELMDYHTECFPQSRNKLKMAEQEIHHISSMSDDEVRRVYFATFKRRRPVKE